MNRNNKVFLSFVLGAAMLFSACSRAVISYDSFSSRDDFARALYHPNIQTEKMLFTQYVQSGLTTHEQREFDEQPIQTMVREPGGHEFRATPRGLNICAPKASQNQHITFHLRILRGIAHTFHVISRSFFGFDGFGSLIESTQSCNLIDGAKGLPHENLTSIALCNNSGEVVIGSTKGVVLLSSGKFYYFAGRGLLSDNYVVNIFCRPSGTMLVKTKTGYSKIARVSLTLEEKEKYFSMQRERFRFGGIINSLRNGIRSPGDNDGLWTSLVVAADSFQYATTHDKQARMRARESIRALMFLERVTDTPGYFARTAFREDDIVAYNWKQKKGDWNYSETHPGWIWKGDTSVDELVGHLFAYTVYYDLVADKFEKRAIRNVVGRIADRMLTHNINIVDHRGKITTWGLGNPNNTSTDTRAFFGKGPISLGTLSAVKIMAHITERDDMRAMYRQLIEEYGMALGTLNAKISIPPFINHSDDQLMFLSYYNLIRLERDSHLKNLYLLGLDRYWQMERAERNPLWNFIYCALSGNMCDIETGLLTLREFPLDLIIWGMKNSHRSDITLQFFRDRRGSLQSNEVLPYSDRAVGRWNSNPYVLDSNGDSSVELDPVMWLLPYWLGKYYNLF
ncbi:MAG: hypothetical protein A3C81_00080 [Candidatus Yanofskybacteria bacterium RIFCSPHIGHO2_02_FULL_46_19]|uniref:Alpha-L-rhamnosidase six-hairpin glycosidase domain-containing protein n=1 Tax=Candidatus Yanofskybacteria bacterium RIFCSPHIGHO2_02_FULL_46_19 TaxID=1802684 RepID=A0A1F8FSA1_9BACT|nr:MAG: hypothetical protein A3C81_00080 [Candidatus Yanofskybacteria bacterium RIFCSPHIGHO2_02_FULL_46_19]